MCLPIPWIQYFFKLPYSISEIWQKAEFSLLPAGAPSPRISWVRHWNVCNILLFGEFNIRVHFVWIHFVHVVISEVFRIFWNSEIRHLYLGVTQPTVRYSRIPQSPKKNKFCCLIEMKHNLVMVLLPKIKGPIICLHSPTPRPLKTCCKEFCGSVHTAQRQMPTQVHIGFCVKLSVSVSVSVLGSVNAP